MCCILELIVEILFQVLDISGNSLSEVSPDILAKAVVKLVEVDMIETDVTSDQCQHLMDVIRSAKDKTLEFLDISENDLREVDPKVMAEAVNKLEMVCLSDMPILTEAQMKEILTCALEKGTALRELSVSPERRTISVFHEEPIKIMYNKLFPRADLPK